MSNNRIPTPQMVEYIRKRYPVGCRIELHGMDDPKAVPPGTKGTVVYVDDMGQLGMKWDNGRSLSLVPGVDSFSRIDAPKREKKKADKGREVIR